MNQQAPRVLLIAVGLLAALLVSLLPTESASADAKSGTCAAGYRLGSYTYSYPAYNRDGYLMWRIKWRKRWWYSVGGHRVGSVYAPRPEVAVYGIFDNTWSFKGITSSDSYYTDRGPRGGRHPRFPRWGHVSWWTVKMNHCAMKWTLCTAHYYKVGTVSYWDGSKKVILP